MRPVRLQRLERDQHARADGEALGELVGLGLDGGADRHLRGAEREPVADLEAQPLEQDRIDGRAGLAADGVARATRPPESVTVADQRIGGIDALHLDQRLLAAVEAARHGAHGGDLATRPWLPQPLALGALGRPMRPRQRHVAAEQRLALALEARAQRVGKRADAGDDRDAQRDAGDEDVEAPEAVALLAQRQARAPAAAPRRNGLGRTTGTATRHADASSAPAMLPVQPCAPCGRSARRDRDRG